MATPFTGNTGGLGSQMGLVQLGGPPVITTFGRNLPASARPYIAHAYQNDGVAALSTSSATFSTLNRPSLNPTLANGGYNQILLEVAAPISGLAQGNVVRLSEQGGDGSFVYSGIVEDLPDTISPTGVSHQILLSPFAVELDDTFSTSVYTLPTDVTQVVRDAVALTSHCTCDQVSVPPATGTMLATTGTVDFRNQPVRQVIDTCRSIMGSTWFWHVDHLGRVWFQAMGSAAAYTVPRGQYEERRVSASIQNRKNKIVAVGGIPTSASANITATYNGSSQSTIGVRALSPPLSIPTITDQTALTSIANNVGAVLDRVWNRVDLKVLPTFGKRIHASQPGGAMIRYWEPAKSPMQESAQGSGGYSGPYIAQSMTSDGLYQDVVAGDIPVTSQTDVQNMIQSLVHQLVAGIIQNPVMPLNQPVVLGPAFHGMVVDANGITRAEFGNLGATTGTPSGAQSGIRFSSATAPLADSTGLIAVMSQLGQGVFTGPSNFTTTTPTVLTGTPVTFTLARAQRVLITVAAQGNTTGNSGRIDIFLDGAGDWLGWLTWGVGGPTVSSAFSVSDALAAGSHTYDCRAFVTATPGTFTVNGVLLSVYGLGG